VQHVVESDGGAITVTEQAYHGEFRPDQLDPGDEGRGPPVGPLEAVAGYVVAGPARTADAGGQKGLLPGYVQLGQRQQYGLEDDPVAAAGTPHMG
jgi:hypothetical protein